MCSTRLRLIFYSCFLCFLVTCGGNNTGGNNTTNIVAQDENPGSPKGDLRIECLCHIDGTTETITATGDTLDLAKDQAMDLCQGKDGRLSKCERPK